MRNIQTLKKLLFFWELFIGLGAVWGTCMMFYDPSGKTFGMDPLLKLLQVLPFSDILFQDFLFSGFVLFIVNGFTNFIAYYLLRRKSRFAGIAGMLCGIILMLWIVFQFVIFDFNILSNTYFIFGVVQAFTAYKFIKAQKAVNS